MNRDVCEHFVPADLHCDHCADKSSTPSLKTMNSDEALRLAAELESGRPVTGSAAAELRRLHEANEAFGKRQEWWNDRMFALERQRDALLEALRMMRVKYGEYACRVCDNADAAIAKAEENT